MQLREESLAWPKENSRQDDRTRAEGGHPLFSIQNVKQGKADKQMVNATRLVRVLEVDDDADVAESQAMLLRSLGAHVRIANSGEAALALVPDFKPHLVVTDIHMPGMDGCETARRIRQLPEGKGVILAALTACDRDDTRQRIKDAGFDHHLVKPSSVDALEQLLASLCKL